MVNLSPLQTFGRWLVVAVLGLGAAFKATRLIGSKNVMELRYAVLQTWPSPLGWTHLNDVLRALVDVLVQAARF